MKVYVVRHGQSTSNLAGISCGWTDVDLTPQGEQDALKAKDILNGIAFDKVYSSDLLRARRTAAIALPDATPELTPLLREINVGNMAGTVLSTIPLERRIRLRREGYHEFGGETHDEFQSRARDFLSQLETLDCENVAVFTHAGLLISMLEAILAAPIIHQNVRCANCAVGIFEYTGAQWKLYGWINP